MQANTNNSATQITLQDCLNEASAAKSLAIRARNMQHQHAGQYLSSQRGRGMELDELRLYQAGDDIRSIDWNVTARTGKTHTKLYREERERPVLFWLDLRAPMFFATRVAFKAVIAAKITALLAWVAYQQGDKLGGFIFSDNTHAELRPSSGRKGLMHLLHQISQHPAWQTDQTMLPENIHSNWQHALQRIATVAPTGSQIFMLSDFFDVDIKDHALLTKLTRHHDIYCIQITDPFERALPKAGDLHIQSDQQTLTLHTQLKKNRDQYQHYFSQRQQAFEKLCRGLLIQHFMVSTDEDYRRKLLELFKQ